VRTGMSGEPLRIISAGVFGLCMLAVYFSSTLLHAVRVPRVQRVLLECDHIAIHLLIAGTYTPLMLVTVGGAWGWTLFGLVWTLAAGGIALRIITRGRRPLLAVGVYIAMGWIGVIGADRLVAAFTAAGLALIVAGGLAYTSGVVFFLWRRLPFNHALWHAFVLAGTICHYLAIWHEVASPAAG